MMPKYSSSSSGLKKYFYCWLGEFRTNSLGLFLAISFLYFVYKKLNLDYFVFGILQIDKVFFLELRLSN